MNRATGRFAMMASVLGCLAILPAGAGAVQVQAQMRAGHDSGIDSWMLWNPGSRYSLDALKPETPQLADSASAGRR